MTARERAARVRQSPSLPVMPPATRSAKKLRQSRQRDPSALKLGWLEAVFGCADLGPLVVEHLDRLEDIVSYARTCRALRRATSALLLNAQAIVTHNGEHNAIRIACAAGNLRAVEFLVRKRVPLDEECMDAAISGEHIHVLKRMHTVLGWPMSRRTAYHAAAMGKLCVLKWLRSIGVAWDELAMRAATVDGHVDCLRYILDTGHILKEEARILSEETSYVDRDPDRASAASHYNWALECAAEGGQIECMQVLLDAHPGAYISCAAAERAATHGQLKALKWMWPRMPSESPHAAMCALTEDHVQCLEFLYGVLEDTPGLGATLIDMAVVLCRPKCLGFMLEQGFEMTPERQKRLLVEQPNSECIRVCADHGLVWTPEQLTIVALQRNPEAVKMMRKKLRVPWEGDLMEKLAIVNPPRFEMFRLGLKLGAPVKPCMALTLCCCNKPRELDYFLREHNPILNTIEMQACLTKNHVECAEIIVRHQGKAYKERMRRFAQRVIDLGESERSPEEENDFMERVFG